MICGQRFGNFVATVLIIIAHFSNMWLRAVMELQATTYKSTQYTIHHPPVCRQGFYNLRKKAIYPYRTNLLIPFPFKVPNLDCGPLVAKYLPKNGVSWIVRKTICSINFIHSIYPYGVSVLALFQFCVPSLSVGSLVAEYLPENGVAGI